MGLRVVAWTCVLWSGGCRSPEVRLQGEISVEVGSPVPGAAWVRVGGVRSEALAGSDGQRGWLVGSGAPWSLTWEQQASGVVGELQVADEPPRAWSGTWIDGRVEGTVEPGARLPGATRHWAAVDVGDVIVVRPTSLALGAGLLDTQFDELLREVVGNRGPYDFALVVESPGLPSRLRGRALSSFVPMQGGGVRGVGLRDWEGLDGLVRGVVWMNDVDTWAQDDPLADWVFCQELAHWRLASARVDRGSGPERVLLGRGGYHWSYFLHTGTSPMEGNTWIDHGDGTFTSDPAAGLGGFSSLDRYLLGLISPEQVAPFFLIEPEAGEAAQSDWPPEARHGDAPRTVRGARVDLTVEDVIRAEGVAFPGPDEVDRELRLVTMLVVGPDELVPATTLGQVERLQARWIDAWETCTEGGSAVQVELMEEGATWAR